MNQYRKIPVGGTAENAVTVGIERDAQGSVRAAVWWPSKGDMDADEASYDTVEEALEAAEAAKALHGFAEIVVTLQSDDLWRAEWGTLANAALSDDESFELARATEAMRDA